MREGKTPDFQALDLVSATGVPFRVLLITGPDGAPNLARWQAGNGPILEFHDRRYGAMSSPSPGFSAHGQFVSCYNVETIRAHESGRGLTLWGDVPGWEIDGWAMDVVRTWLELAHFRS